MGLPYDLGTTAVPGQRHGPELLRKFSRDTGFTLDIEGRLCGVIDPVTRQPVLSGRRVYDIGDLGGVPIDVSVTRTRYLKSAKRAAFSAAQLSEIPVIIGGDHSISAATVEGIKESAGEPLALVCFDAHCDIAPSNAIPSSYNELTHANFISYLLHTKSIAKADIVGVRTFLTEAHCPIPRTITSWSGNEPSKEYLSGSSPIYLSIDMDVLSPEFFPATGHPEWAGFSPTTLLAALREVTATNRVVAVDIVEASYSDQWNSSTARAMGSTLLAILRMLHDNYSPSH